MLSQLSVSERFRLQFRVEAFNATSTPHFNNPGANASSPSRDAAGNILLDSSGVPGLSGFMEITGVRCFGRDSIDDRVFQFGLRPGF
jgi:hypothetical protein